jgi:hypothetical protein
MSNSTITKVVFSPETDTCAHVFYENGVDLAVPTDPGNRHYQEYLEWVAAGNSPTPSEVLPEPEPPTPAEKLAASGLTVDELKELLGL